MSASDEVINGWRECADPVELAAAVAAGVEVLCVTIDGREWETGCEDSESFRRCMANDCRYRVPASWSPEPPAPEGVRRVWTCKVGGNVTSLPGGADAPMRRAVATAFTELTGHPVEFCFSGWGDDLDEAELAVVEDRAPDPEVIRAALVERLAALPDPSPGVTSMACDHPNPCTSEPPGPDDLVSRARRYADKHPKSRDLIEALLAGYEPCVSNPCEACRGRMTAPVPPWPGAVLSGCVDEDGVPTWLAQAGQVRGEQVRGVRNAKWRASTTSYPTEWVEVRAPRAVPAPETAIDPTRRRRGRPPSVSEDEYQRAAEYYRQAQEQGRPTTAAVADGLGVSASTARKRIMGARERALLPPAESTRPRVRVVEGGTKLHSPVAPDGTVEVLRRDGDQ